MGRISKQIYVCKLPPGQDGLRSVNVYLLEGYNDCSITAYQRMADELRQTFPQATYDDIKCGRVHRSDSCDGHSIIEWHGRIDLSQEYPGWRICQGEPEYDWR